MNLPPKEPSKGPFFEIAERFPWLFFKNIFPYDQGPPEDGIQQVVRRALSRFARLVRMFFATGLTAKVALPVNPRPNASGQRKLDCCMEHPDIAK